MSHLRPFPFPELVRRAFEELKRHQSIFDLPKRKFFSGESTLDLSISFHGMRAGTPLGPAAGPHTQLAQNIVLCWLAGGRVMELKTVQILDRLDIPRPCIDMETIGYNVEWSQELRLEQSLQEYVKASMLIEMLQNSAELGFDPGLEPLIFDMSVGYDLAGIRSEQVVSFMRGLKDASAVVAGLRSELRKGLPPELLHLAELDFNTQLSNTLTLSTFHGCPPTEIESIVAFLLEEQALDCVVKLNPTLLGPARLRELLNDAMGYRGLHVPDDAFEQDATWSQAVDFVGRLSERASGLGRSLGVKFSNTLIVDNHRDFFPESEKRMYVSGPPLHALAIELVDRFRGVFADRFEVSFSAGIDKDNFADAVALGLKPVTVCTDLLKNGGYGRTSRYFSSLKKRMVATKASTVEEFIIAGAGHGQAALQGLGLSAEDETRCLLAMDEGDSLKLAAGPHFEQWVSAAILLNTRAYAAKVIEDPRYGQAANARGPKRVDSKLKLFDCLTCDICVPVCPNDANFRLLLDPAEITSCVLSRDDEGSWVLESKPSLSLAKKHQLACFADFCNECGNCDVFCPEEGGPYAIKPLFFGSEAAWTSAEVDGFHLAEGRLLGRIGGQAFAAEFPAADSVRFSGADFELSLSLTEPATTAEGAAQGPVDLTPLYIMKALYDAMTTADGLNYPALLASGAPTSG